MVEGNSFGGAEKPSCKKKMWSQKSPVGMMKYIFFYFNRIFQLVKKKRERETKCTNNLPFGNKFTRGVNNFSITMWTLESFPAR